MTRAGTTARLVGPGTTPQARELVPPQLRVDVAAAGVLLVQLVAYAAVVVPGSFYRDDLVATDRAVAGTLSWRYLRTPGGQELGPAAQAWSWLQAQLAPLDHTVAVLSVLTLQALVTAATWWLLRSLFGPRPLALVPLAVFAFAPLSLPTTAWWLQAVCLLPVALSIVAATEQHLRFLRGGRIRNAVAAGGSVVLGLLFSEKAVLAAVLPVLLTLLCFTPGPGVRARLRSVLRRWPAWLCLGLPVVALAVLHGPLTDGARPASLTATLRLLGSSTTHVVLPAMLGGPWRWTRTQPYALANPPDALVVATGSVLLVLVVLSLWRRPQAWRGWVLLAVYVPLSVAVTAALGLAPRALDAGRDVRPVADVSVALAVAVGLVLLPLREEPTAAHLVPAGRSAALRRAAVAVATVAVVAWAGSAGFSSVRFAQRWQENPTGSYLAHLRSDLALSQGTVPLYDGALPPAVLPPSYQPYDSLSALLAQLPGRARFQDGLVPLDVVRTDGHVVAGRLVPVARSRPGPDGACGYALRPGTRQVTVPLVGAAPVAASRTVRVELLLSAPTPVRVEAVDGGAPRRVGDGRLLPSGPAAVVALVPGGEVSSFQVGGLAPGAYACVLSATVGTPAPLGPS